MTALHLVASHLRPYRAPIVVGILLMLVEMLTTLASPWLAGRFTQELLDGGTQIASGPTTLLGLWAVVLLVQFAARAASTYMLSVSSAGLMTDLGRRVHDHLQVLPLSFHQERRSGELLALLSHDVTQLSHFVSGPLAGMLPLVALLLGAIGMILVLDPVFGLAVILLAPVLIVLIKLLGRRVRPLATAAVREQANSLAVANETLSMLRLIKAHAVEEVRNRAYRDQTAVVLALRRQQLWLQATLVPVVFLVASLALLGLLWWAGQRVAAGQLSAPDLVSISLYGLLLIRPISGLGGAYLQLEQARGAAQRLSEVLQEKPEPRYASGQRLGRLVSEIAFRDVWFSYPQRPPLLRGIELVIRKGEAVALTGENGTGKTTLVHLLMRFVAPDEGAVLIDGQDIATADLLSLRRQIGYVPQEILLANGSIRDNIAFGRPDADEQAVVMAARLAKAEAFIRELPDGYDTMVGDQGAKLSGGQRQRLALARALLANPEILILDEATSQIDHGGEAAFIDAVKDLVPAMTVIIITHRPAMLALANRVYRLEDGALHEGFATSHGKVPHSG